MHKCAGRRTRLRVGFSPVRIVIRCGSASASTSTKASWYKYRTERREYVELPREPVHTMSFFATDGGISNFRTSNAFQTRGAQLTRQQPLGSLLDVITLGPTCYTTQDSRTALACLSATLPNFDQYWISYGPGSGNEYYSPAVCPSGYNVNTFDTTAWDTRLPAASGGETIGFCCKV